MSARPPLSLSQRLRVHAAVCSSVGITLAPDDARWLARVLDDADAIAATRLRADEIVARGAVLEADMMRDRARMRRAAAVAVWAAAVLGSVLLWAGWLALMGLA